MLPLETLCALLFIAGLMYLLTGIIMLTAPHWFSASLQENVMLGLLELVECEHISLVIYGLMDDSGKTQRSSRSVMARC